LEQRREQEKSPYQKADDQEGLPSSPNGGEPGPILPGEPGPKLGQGVEGKGQENEESRRQDGGHAFEAQEEAEGLRVPHPVDHVDGHEESEEAGLAPNVPPFRPLQEDAEGGNKEGRDDEEVAGEMVDRGKGDG
jgi:hypothetical protein